MLKRITRRCFSAYDYDLTVIGGGPGGYVAAIKAAQLGLRTACVEKRGSLGGTCLNVGCIPAKALLNSSHKYFEASHHFKQHGINFSSLSVDFPQMMSLKQQSVTGLTKGIEGLFKKNKVDYHKGAGVLSDQHTVNVDGQQLTSSHIILAVGSEPIPIPILPFDEERVLSSTGAMALKQIPSKMLVIGGGVIGLELGSVYSRIGSEVTIIEFADSLAPFLDTEASKSLAKILQKQGIKFIMGAKVVGGESSSNGVRLKLEAASANAKDVPESIEGDVVLVSVGRGPSTHPLGLDKLDISRDNRRRINVNDNLQTLRYNNVYAVGDCIRGPMLAHKAEEEGIFAVEHIVHKSGHLNYNAIPSVIYTMPEVASLGMTEQQLVADKVPFTKGVFPLMANSRARANHDSDGFVKVLAHKETNELLGCHMIGSVAGEIIMETALGLEYGATCEDIARTCHAHPCYTEAIKEACLATFSKTINF